VATAGWIVSNDNVVRGGVVVESAGSQSRDVLETFGLGPETLDIASMSATLPDFGTVTVFKLDIETMNQLFDNQAN